MKTSIGKTEKISLPAFYMSKELIELYKEKFKLDRFCGYNFIETKEIKNGKISI